MVGRRPAEDRAGPRRRPGPGLARRTRPRQAFAPNLRAALQTSEAISQRKPSASRWKFGSWAPTRTGCSTNATCRQVSAPRPPEFSCERPAQCRPSSGMPFHSLRATSQALHPMHSEVSVKNPTRGGWRR